MIIVGWFPYLADEAGHPVRPAGDVTPMFVKVTFPDKPDYVGEEWLEECLGLEMEFTVRDLGTALIDQTEGLDKLPETLTKFLLAEVKTPADEIQCLAKAGSGCNCGLPFHSGPHVCRGCGAAWRDVFEAAPEVKVCASETCDNEFRWQDGPGEGRRSKGVMYCSDRCAKAQAQREYRRRQKATT